MVWTDVRLPDPDAGPGRTFYTSLFGYCYEPIEGAPPDYTMIRFDAARDGESVGGIGGMMGAPEGTPPHWLAYFQVADADADGVPVDREHSSETDEQCDDVDEERAGMEHLIGVDMAGGPDGSGEHHRDGHSDRANAQAGRESGPRTGAGGGGRR